MNLLVIDGPNINLLGIREPEIYGNSSYMELLDLLNNTASELNIRIDHFQSNSEGAIIDRIHEALPSCDGIVINAAAYTHTSLAIGDALRAVNIPTIEVHITDTSSREGFRKINFIRDYALTHFEGLGIKGYKEAIHFLHNYLLTNDI